MMFGEWASTTMVAVAMIGLPLESSQVSSQAFQMSLPWNGRSSPRPNSLRAVALSTGKSTPGAYSCGYSVGVPSVNLLIILCGYPIWRGFRSVI